MQYDKGFCKIFIDSRTRNHEDDSGGSRTGSSPSGSFGVPALVPKHGVYGATCPVQVLQLDQGKYF